MEIQGKIKLIGETQTVGSNGFRKRELVVTTEEQFTTNRLPIIYSQVTLR